MTTHGGCLLLELLLWAVCFLALLRTFVKSSLPGILRAKIAAIVGRLTPIGSIANVSEKQLNVTARNAIKISVLAILAGLGYWKGYSEGYIASELAAANNTHTRKDDLIVAAHSGREFSMRSSNGINFETRLCPSENVDWKPGERFKEWRYTQRDGCKGSIYFTMYTDQNSGDRIKFPIQEVAYGR